MKQASGATFSYEFFPPRTAKMERRLWRTMGQLERLQPEFYSMTYGALGSAQQVSIDAALAMQAESPVEVAAHLTCANASAEQVLKVARGFQAAGIRRIVALRGDAVDDAKAARGYAFPSAVELVAALGDQIDDVDITVAAYPEGHPQAHSPAEDLRHLQRKFKAGASRAITQYFFDADHFLRFRDRALALGIEAPIIPGILPIHDLHKVHQFSKRCGASVPSHYWKRYEPLQGDPQACYQLSVELATNLCERLLLEGVQHFHFYTLNQTDMCLDISLALGARLNSTRVPSAA